MDRFSEARFHDDVAARAYLEGVLWPDGPVCAHCGVVDHAYATKRPGVYRCAEVKCRKDFSVTKNTVMERSKIALHKWMQAFHLMCSSKKGISAHQMHRTMDITYEAAWFMAMRIREAMRDGGLSPLGGSDRIVEADETYFGDVHTNSAEGYFSIFKRGMKGTYQFCKEKHLHRYLAEFDFRYNHRIKLGYNDGDRAALAVKNAAGKRLTYRGPDGTKH